MLKRLPVLISLWCLSLALYSQTTVVTGKVTDAATSEALPYVTIFFKGTQVGANSDFDGNFRVSTTLPVDSIIAQFIGYQSRVKAVKTGQTQVINFQLEAAGFNLEELVVRPGPNPAHRIIRAAQDNRAQNNPDKLKAYECESFNKIQIAVDNVSDKLKKRKLFKEVSPLFDTISQFTGEDGKPVLPVFISETISDFYFQKDPKKTKEYIRANRISGVGVEDGTFISQLLGSTFQQYNFYEHWNRILDKDFVSPISNSAFLYYDYTLLDSTEIDGLKCYRIQIKPKRPQDLAFNGTIWIADGSFALKRVVLEIDKAANLNFIDKLKIQQEMVRLEDGSWMPSKTRVMVNIAQVSKTSAGMIAIFYSSNKNFVINKERPPQFYDQTLILADDFDQYQDTFWQAHRHEQLTESDRKIYQLVDSLRNLPTVRTYIEWIQIIIDGYKPLGPIDVGPYALIYSYNALEGNRFRLGFRTNAQFSRKWVISAYGAYGTLDNRFKYNAQLEYILSRKRWTTIGAKHRLDVEQIGVSDNNYGGGNLFTTLNMFNASQLNRLEENKFWVSSEFRKGWTERITFHQKYYEFVPINGFNFAYYTDPFDTANSDIASSFTNTSLTFSTRFAYRELFLVNDNERISLGTDKAPAFTLNYTKGLKMWGGQFNYDKVSLNIAQNLNLGLLGNGKYSVTASKIFGRLPYPILDVQRGNESFITSYSAYNLMNFFEFVCDEYVAASYEQHFEGLLFNRLPAIRKLKWRMFAGTKSIWGSVTPENKALLPRVDNENRPVTTFDAPSQKPYVEVNYGVENIFKVLRVDFLHRLTYRQNPGAQRFGVKITAQVTF